MNNFFFKIQNQWKGIHTLQNLHTQVEICGEIVQMTIALITHFLPTLCLRSLLGEHDPRLCSPQPFWASFQNPTILQVPAKSLSPPFFNQNIFFFIWCLLMTCSCLQCDQCTISVITQVYFDSEFTFLAWQELHFILSMPTHSTWSTILRRVVVKWIHTEPNHLCKSNAKPKRKGLPNFN